MTDLILIRHGQTEANVAGRWEGWSEGILTPLGWTQAEAAACHLGDVVDNVVGLYTSPLRRAFQTACIVGAVVGVRPIGEHDLREINFGDLDGITLEKLENSHPELFAQWRNREDLAFAWPGGERRADFHKRVTDACQRILSRHPEGTVIIVSHGGTLRALLAHLLPDHLGDWWKYTIDNCAITQVAIGENGAALSTFNDRSHLPDDEV